MDVILIPGLWLDASSWDDIVPRLQDAGHTTHPLTLPGAGTEATAPVHLSDWVAAVTAVIDAVEGPVALVGHSGGGNVAWGAADARVDRVSRVVFVDTLPPPPGAMISEFPVVDDVVPFPGREFFDEPDVADLDAPTRERWAARTRPVPGAVPTDPVELTDPRRRGIPITVLSGSADRGELLAMLAEWPSFLAEFESVDDVTVARLGTGHWPQFSRPSRLADALTAALA